MAVIATGLSDVFISGIMYPELTFSPFKLSWLFLSCIAFGVSQSSFKKHVNKDACEGAPRTVACGNGMDFMISLGET